MTFTKLTSPQKVKTLARVNKLFDKHFWHEFRKFQFTEFENQFPNEYHNTGVDKLVGTAKELYETQNKKEIEMVAPIWQSITARETKKEYIKGYKSPNKQRGGLKGWLKKQN